LYKSKRKIYVGDPDQSIFSFRGSNNAMLKIKDATKFYLNETFRYTPEIANKANLLLNRFKGVDEKIISNIKDKSFKFDKKKHQRAYITKTNALLIEKMQELFEAKTAFKTVRNPKEIFSLSLDLLNLRNGKKDKIWGNKFLLNFSDFEQAEAYAEEADDIELQGSVRLVNKHGAILFKLMAKAKEYFESNTKISNVLTTAHTSKGLEWDSVEIGHDFSTMAEIIAESGFTSLKDFVLNHGKADVKHTEAINLLYVTFTRAKRELLIPDEIDEMLTMSEEDINLEISTILADKAQSA